MMMPSNEFAKRLFVTFPGLIDEINVVTVAVLIVKHSIPLALCGF
jgi:hypothetical protein